MKNCFIVHGAYGSPAENWVPWLEKELGSGGYEVIVPTFPTPEGQNYKNWMQVIEPYLSDFNEETILIGHSIGASFTLAILEKIGVQIKQTVLVSGFVGPLDLDFDEINKTIAEREYDWNKVKSNSLKFTILHGKEDPYVPDKKADQLGQLLDAEPIFIPKGGHLNEAAGFKEFPLLLKQVI